MNLFGFMPLYQIQIIKPQDSINIKPAYRLEKLQDALKALSYEIHTLLVYLMRLLFFFLRNAPPFFKKGCFKIILKPTSTQMSQI